MNKHRNSKRIYTGARCTYGPLEPGEAETMRGAKHVKRSLRARKGEQTDERGVPLTY